jgi:alkylation response protein AidB-like acyl-CoA dehydrogenase
MKFGFTAEQDLLRKSFSEFLNKECPIETVRESLESEKGFSPGIWKKIAALGWLGLGYPEV